MTASRRNLAPYYFVVTGVVLQGFSPVLTKLLLDHLSPATLVGARYALAVLTLLPFGLVGTRRAAAYLKPRPRDWAALFLVGALGSGIGALAFTSAIHFSSAGVANAISKTGPLFVAFFAYFTLRERITSVRLLLVLVIVAADLLIGAGEITAGGGMALAGPRLMGAGLALVAGIARALSEILAKSALRHFPASAVSLWRFSIGFLLTGAISFATGDYRGLLSLDVQGWVLLGLLGIVATALSMSVYYRGAARIPAHVAVTLKLLGTVVTAVLSYFILNETLNLYHVMGIGLIVSAGYLLVVRTAQMPEAEITREPPKPRRSRRPSMALRTRIAIFTSAIVVVTVFPLTFFSISHTTTVITQQTQLTMSRVATMMVQLAGLSEPPSRIALKQYMDRVVATQIEGNLYTIDIVYAALVNERGNMLVLSVNQRIITLVSASGLQVQASEGEVARQFLAMARTGQLSQTYDIVPVTAQLLRDNKPAFTVLLGCRRSIANRAIAEIAARMAALAFLIAALGILLSTVIMGKLTRPLEAIARAMARISAGDRDVAVLARGDEQSEAITRALGQIVADLRSADALHTELVHYAASAAAREQALVAGEDPSALAVVLISRVPADLFSDNPAQTHALLSGYFDILVTTTHTYDGLLAGQQAGLIVARWGESGEETDDPLRATLAALELDAAFERAGLAARFVVGAIPVVPGAAPAMGDAETLWRDLAADDEREPGVLLSDEIAAMVEEVVVVEPRAEGRTGYRARTEEGEEELRAAAGGTDE